MYIHQARTQADKKSKRGILVDFHFFFPSWWFCCRLSALCRLSAHTYRFFGGVECCWASRELFSATGETSPLLLIENLGSFGISQKIDFSHNLGKQIHYSEILKFSKYAVRRQKFPATLSRIFWTQMSVAPIYDQKFYVHTSGTFVQAYEKWVFLVIIIFSSWWFCCRFSAMYLYLSLCWGFGCCRGIHFSNGWRTLAPHQGFEGFWSFAKIRFFSQSSQNKFTILRFWNSRNAL